jgi:hypothetical protein
MLIATCKSCAYFRQHYTFDKRRIFSVHCGHCTCGTPKRKRPDTAACESYIYGEPNENAFVSKEYLSKELLQYLLNLEMLPAIEDGSSDTKKL